MQSVLRIIFNISTILNDESTFTFDIELKTTSFIHASTKNLKIIDY